MTEDLTVEGRIPVAEIEAVKAKIPLHVYHNGHEWYVATSADEAKEMCLRCMHCPGPEHKNYELYLEDAEGDGWQQVPDDEEFQMWVDDPPTTQEKRTCAEWAVKNGAGFLASTEY